MSDAQMIPCDQVIAKLWEYVDGELPQPASEQVREHLDICGRCFPQYDFQRAYLEFVARTGAHPVPPGLRRRVFEAILAEEAERDGGTHPAPEPAPPGRGERLRRLLGRIFGGR